MDSTSPHGSTAPAPRPIFRAEALRLHARAHGQPVLPRFTTPFAVACCWWLVALLAASLALAWLCQVPLVASGGALVAPTSGPVKAKESPVAIVLLSPDRVGSVRAGDTVVLRFGTQTLTRPLASVDSRVSSPAEVRQRFGLTGGVATAIDAPVLVGTVALDHVPADLSAAVYPGAIGLAQVEVGSQRVASLLPIVDRYFG